MNKKIYDRLLKRVRRGMQFLDKEVPGWEHKIDTKALDLGDSHACVLGQLFTGFWEKVYAVEEIDGNFGKMSVLSATLRGFNSRADRDNGGFDDLTRVWCKKILELRKKRLRVTV